MKRIIVIALALVCIFTLSACNIEELFNKDHNCEDHNDNVVNDPSIPYFTGEVIEKNEKGFLVSVTDSGNGAFAIGEKVQVNTELAECPEYQVGEELRIAFDGKVAMSYPPQVTSVYSVTEVGGNN